MFRSKLRGGSLPDLILITILIILVYVFITRQGNSSNSDTEPCDETENHQKNSDTHSSQSVISNHLIDSRIKSLPDYRSPECSNVAYSKKTRVSIIIDFYDYQFYDVKTTISGITENTPDDLIEEILMINDGSSLIYIGEEAESLAKSLKKGRLLKNDQQMGSAKARMRALREAKSDIVVFIDHNVIVNKGWLEPLLVVLERHPKSIAVPHYDHINDPVSYELKSTPENLVSSLSWRMITRMTETKVGKQEQDLYNSPVVRGNVFAVKKDYFKSIGGYEESLAEFGGENLELSVRAWLCGGPIFVVPCSRVGVLNLKDPVKIQSYRNLRLITEVWFDGYKDVIYRSSNVDSTLSDSDRTAIKHMVHKKKSMQCKNIDWYIEDIVRDIASPSDKAKFFGLLRCKSGRCAKLGKDGRIDLGQCSPDKYGVHSSDMLFEYDSERRVKVNGKCLSTQGTAYITAEDCVDGNEHQLYAYTDKLELQNVWSGYCWMHVTDPDKVHTDGRRQIAMAQACNTDTSEGGQFKSFEFIPL